jgi:hypothetical protein
MASAVIAWNRYSVVEVAPRSSLLWSAFFRSPHSTQIITSDPNIAEIEAFTGGQLSVSDYANHNYIPDPSKLTPEVTNFCRNILRGDKAAAVDMPIAVYIGQMALASSRNVSVHAARSIQIQDLASEDNFVFLGSPRTNPWSALFSDQLDFRFVFDPKAKTEFIRNERPRPQEASTYVPTAPGWANRSNLRDACAGKKSGSSRSGSADCGSNGRRHRSRRKIYHRRATPECNTQEVRC